jgi:nitroreductase
MKDEVLNMYEYILKRKSVRSYDMGPLDSETINDIEKYIETIQPYNSLIKTQTFLLHGEKKISGLFKCKAPHYVAITSERKGDYLINAGYILEQLVIYLTSKGIGTCFLGGAKPTTEFLKDNPLKFVVMIALGKSNESIYREDISEFKRKAITEISNLTKINSIMEAARLAPSGYNQQPWYFLISKNKISVYYKRVITFMDRMTKIDIGIALAHIYIAATDQGKKIELSIKTENKVMRGYEYVITCRLV